MVRSTTQRRLMRWKPGVGLDALDDFDRPLAQLFEYGFEFVAGVAGIGEDMAQPGKGIADGGEEERAPSRS